MKIKIFILAFLLLSLGCLEIYSQSISGRVVNSKNEGIEYATIISKGSGKYAISGKEGSFSIHCPHDSSFIWTQFACLGYKEKMIKLYKGEKDISIVLQEDVSALDEVLVRPSKYSSFSNYSAQTTKLNTFEIVTNPSALGDIIAGVKITPGVQSNDNDGRLIINGGATDESQIYVDGLIMFNPYTLSQKNVSVRSRLTPDLFSGISLYAGGYSSQYGHALSGILQLNTLSTDELTSKIDLNLNTTGMEVSLIHKGKEGAYRGNVSYMNLTPYGKIVKDDYDWKKYYNQLSTNHYYEKKLKKNGYIKNSFYYSNSSVDYSYNNIDQLRFNNDLKEHNLLGSIVSSVKLADKWGLYYGVNFAYNRFKGTDVSIKSDVVRDEKINSHSKISLRYMDGQFSNNFGVENVYSSFNEQYTLDEIYKLKYQDNLIACFNEYSWLVNNFNLNAGLRGEYSTYLKRFNWSPRVYMSYKPTMNHIISFTLGRYFQQPSENYLKYLNDLKFKESRIGTLSYSYIKGSSKLQADLFYKKYDDLPTFIRENFYYTNIKSNGDGHIKGFSLFMRKNYRNFEYWMSYSYTEANIKSEIFKSAVQPSYLAKNALNMTTKYWFSPLRSMLGASFFIDSGAMFYNKEGNLSTQRKSPYRHRLDLSWSYLPTKGVIIHFSCQNVLGKKNVYGYEHSSISSNIRPVSNPGKQFFYIGVFITLSKSNINQLKSL